MSHKAQPIRLAYLAYCCSTKSGGQSTFARLQSTSATESIAFKQDILQLSFAQLQSSISECCAWRENTHGYGPQTPVGRGMACDLALGDQHAAHPTSSDYGSSTDPSKTLHTCCTPAAEVLVACRR